jgi:hypothetical protein
MGVEGWLEVLVKPATVGVRGPSVATTFSRFWEGEAAVVWVRGVTPGTEALGGADVKPGGRSGVLYPLSLPVCTSTCERLVEIG